MKTQVKNNWILIMIRQQSLYNIKFISLYGKIKVPDGIILRDLK